MKRKVRGGIQIYCSSGAGTTHCAIFSFSIGLNVELDDEDDEDDDDDDDDDNDDDDDDDDYVNVDDDDATLTAVEFQSCLLKTTPSLTVSFWLWLLMKIRSILIIMI